MTAKSPRRNARSRNGVKLYDPIKWSVVEHPPNEPVTTTLFADEVTARERLWRIQSVGKHAYILPPQK